MLSCLASFIFPAGHILTSFPCPARSIHHRDVLDQVSAHVVDLTDVSVGLS